MGHSFSLLSIIPLYVYTSVHVSIHMLMEIWVVTSCWVLQVKIFYKYLYGRMPFFFWINSNGMSTSYGGIFKFSRNYQTVFQCVCTIAV